MAGIRVTGSRLVLALVLAAGCGESGSKSNPIDCTDINETRCGVDTTCTPDQIRCGPMGEIHRCKAGGDGWDVVAQCAEGQRCSGGQCEPASCQAGDSKCMPDGKVSVCLAEAGTFGTPESCPTGQTCIGTACVPQVCNPHARFCEGDTVVRACDARGTQSSVVEECEGNARCADGACRSPCIVAEMKNTSIGCTFYGVDNDNHASDDPLELDFGVANDSDVPGTVKFEVREGSSWRTVCQIMLQGHEARLVGMSRNCGVDEPTEQLFDRHVEDSGYAEGGAYRVTSDVPVAAYQFNSNDQIRAFSSGGTVLLPRHVLGQKYFASVMPQPDPNNTNRPEDPAHAEIVILGTVDGTKVKITPKAAILAGPGVMATPAGMQVEYMINEGAVLQLASANVGDDLTGSVIESDQPIAVFGNNECATVFPRAMAGEGGFGSTYCDHTEEQLLPLQAWGKNHVAARVRPIQGAPGDLDPTVWRVLASEDNTMVRLDVPMGAVTMPDSSMPFSLNAGEFIDVAIMLPSFEAPSDVMINADKPILAIGYMSGETVATTAVPVEQLLSSYTFLVPGKFTSQITVIRPRGVRVLYDGQPLGDQLFVPAGNDYEVGRIDIDRDDSIGSMPQTHTLATEETPDGMKPKIGIEVRGMDHDCSYGYSGGLSIEIINPIGITAPGR